MQCIPTQMENQPGVAGTELLCQILDTVTLLIQTWRKVETSTITKCFEKTGFFHRQTRHLWSYKCQWYDGDEENYDDGVALSVLKWSNELIWCDFVQFILSLTPATWIHRLECLRTAHAFWTWRNNINWKPLHSMICWNKLWSYVTW